MTGAEIRRITVLGQPRQKSLKTLFKKQQWQKVLEKTWFKW
jgi:hypothetical protein